MSRGSSRRHTIITSRHGQRPPRQPDGREGGQPITRSPEAAPCYTSTMGGGWWRGFSHVQIVNIDMILVYIYIRIFSFDNSDIFIPPHVNSWYLQGV